MNSMIRLSDATSMIDEIKGMRRNISIGYVPPDDNKALEYKIWGSHTPIELARIEKSLAPLAYLKTKEEVFNFTSIYVLIKLSDGFLINDSYDGVMIIDNNLSVRNKIPAFKQLLFDTWYNIRKFDVDEIVFF